MQAVDEASILPVWRRGIYESHGVEQGRLFYRRGKRTDALQTALNLPVQIADDPQLAVIEGAGVVLGQLDGLRRSRAKTPTNWTGLLIFVLIIAIVSNSLGKLIKGVIGLFTR